MAYISFACKKVSIESIIRCGFGLNKTEYKALKYLLNVEEADIISISKNIKKDRTTAQRCIKKLLSQHLISRRQVNLEEGGFVFYYSVKDKNEIKRNVYDNFCNWRDLVEKELKNW